MKNPSTLFWRIWKWPVALNVIAILGLIAPLVGDGVWDAFSWGALGLVVAVCVWFGKLARYRSSPAEKSHQ